MADYKTKVDEVITACKGQKRITLVAIAKQTKTPFSLVESIARVLEKEGALELVYPLNFFSRPFIRNIKPPVEDDSALPAKTKAIDTYDVKDEGVPVAKAHLYEAEGAKRYFVELPSISYYTRLYLNSLKKQIAILNEERARKGQDSKKEKFATILDALKPLAQGDALSACASWLFRDMYGLGKLDLLIADNWLEEIVANSSKNTLAVYHRKLGWMQTSLKAENEDEIENYSAQIARRVGKQINTLNPILDAHLQTGDRVNATLFPISTAGNTITLRLFARNPWTIIHMIGLQKTMSTDMAALLWQAIHYEANVLVGGGTASGKTSALNGVLALIPPQQRIVTIEDTRELLLPDYQWNWVPMATRAANSEGLGEVSMLDLVVNALRMRPDRIIMGEVRRKREAEVLFEAMHTGHSVYATMHADTGSQMLKRLTEPPIEIPPAEVEDIHLVMVQFRDRRRNLRRTLEISEVIPGANGPEINRVFVWRARQDEFQMVKPPHRYIENINLHTGMTEKEIYDDQKEKKGILEWMVKNKIEDINQVGEIIKKYYLSPDEVIEAARKNQSAKKLV